MGKGDKPRSCFSIEYKDNYDEINWSDTTTSNWNEPSEVSMGRVRQNTTNPVKDDQPDCEDDSCANE